MTVQSASPKTFGYYDEPGQIEPTYDPGLNVGCPVCGLPLERPLKTISLMLVGDNQSYFYRTHRACYDNLTPDEKMIYDGAIIDAVANSKNKN